MTWPAPFHSLGDFARFTLAVAVAIIVVNVLIALFFMGLAALGTILFGTVAKASTSTSTPSLPLTSSSTRPGISGTSGSGTTFSTRVPTDVIRGDIQDSLGARFQQRV